jgi:hypothetical protein
VVVHVTDVNDHQPLLADFVVLIAAFSSPDDDEEEGTPIPNGGLGGVSRRELHNGVNKEDELLLSVGQIPALYELFF